MIKFYLIISLVSILALTPAFNIAVATQYEFAASTLGDLINPDKWFEALKQNITIPVSTGTSITIPRPEDALIQASSTLQQINRDVREEVGIDFAKFIGWSAKVLKAFFQIIVNLMETISKTMSSP